MSHTRLVAPVLVAALIVGGCGTTAGSERSADTPGPTASTVESTTSRPAPATTEAFIQPAAPNGRRYPAVPAGVAAASNRLYEVEGRIHTIDPTDASWPDLAHEQQMLYRTIGRTPEWIPEVVAGAPQRLAPLIESHLAARRSIAGIGGEGEPPTNVPAWAIIEPLPAEELRVLFEQASADTGIDWAFLAAINLIETGFGRIDGLSTAGAQGPMQFLPTTFAEVSTGDIDDPADAIAAAARYLVRRGGPDDMAAALFGYNNSDDYVAAVTHYADLFRADERSFLATHSWEIHYAAGAGDLWLPVGFRGEEVQPVSAYLVDAPWSAPPPRS